MSRKKQRKIKKLRQRRIWPHVVLIVCMLMVFTVMFVAIVSFFLTNTIQKKVIEGYENAMKIASVFEEDVNENDVVKDVYQIRQVIPEITSVVILDKNNNVIKQYGQEKPDFSRELRINQGETQMMVIPDEQELVRVDEDGVIEVELAELFHEGDFRDVVETADYNYSDISKTWRAAKCWFIVPYGNDGNNAGIYSEIAISNYEIRGIVGAFLLGIIIIAIFFIYQMTEIIRMVSQQKKAWRIINTDFVTGGFNKVYFKDYGSKLLKYRHKKKYAVIKLRLEKYSNYCMYYTEKEGEDLLEQMYSILKAGIVRREKVAHMEGADFGLIIQYEDEKSLNSRMTEIVNKLEGLRPKQKLYFSVGIIPCDKSFDSTMYYNEAGIALESIAEDGECRIAWFNEDMKAQQIWQRKVENDMNLALENNEFKVYIQPKYDTKSEVLSGGEALIRWIHPTEGFVPPGRFIPIFEKNGFVTKIDDFMITEVSKLQSQWLKEGKSIVPISVNVSRVHFAREDLADHICSIVDAYEVPHKYIELELTESAFFDDKGVLLRTVNRMRELGFHVSMDDFGAGYSSLNSLKELPLDVIKLDAEFFRGADDFDRANLIVSRTIGLAKQLGMTIVAEGIETREQVDFLAKQDCDLIQGFYFAKPMPIDEFTHKAFEA